MTIIPIDRSTVRRNPDYHTSGIRRFLPTGVPGQFFEATTMVGGQLYVFEHQPTELTCEHCGAKFDSRHIRDDYIFDGEDERLVEYCPVCHEPDPCEYDYERLTKAELGRLAEENGRCQTPSA